MGSIRTHFIDFRASPALPQGTKVDVKTTPVPLMLTGLNLPVIVSTATAYQVSSVPQPIKTAQIFAHFDTGASITSIDIELAKHLNLIPVGQTPSNTAAGLRMATNFVIDLGFPGSGLRSFKNLPISSCHLGGLSVPLKFSMLIGRDVMMYWNIIWDGPTSSVIISD